MNQFIDGVNHRDGVQVPMEALLELYSRSKIYDAEPPLSYLLQLIWEHVVIPAASEDPRFGRLHRKQKFEITLAPEEIVDRLHDGFSFSHWHKQYPERQPQVPKREWVEKACQFMVETKEAKWAQEGSSLVIFYRKYDDVLAHFVQQQAELEAKVVLQPMFDLSVNP